MWFLSIALAYWGLCRLEVQSKAKFKIEKNEVIIFAGIAFLAIVIRFLFLDIYPFTDMGDGLRDTGKDAALIATGEIKNIYSYGFANGHGLIIPTICSFFYRILGPELMVYRLPSTIISVLTILLLYVTVRKIVGKMIAIWAALALVGLPLEMFYARTQTVITFTTLWTTLLLFLMAQFLAKRSYKNYGILGLAIGFICNFHASSKVVGFLTLLLIFLISFYYFWKGANRFILLQNFSLMLILILVGFGPKILFSPLDVLFHTERVNPVYAQETSRDFDMKDLAKIPPKEIDPTLKTWIAPFENYPRSLLVYISEKTSYTYRDRKPILGFGLALFFVIGLVFIVFQNSALYKSAWLKLIGVYVFALPITNSAITNYVNSDYRLAPLFPVACIVAAYGISETYKRVSNLNFWRWNRILQLLVILVASSSIGLSAFWFFENETASYGMYRVFQDQMPYHYQDYSFMYAIKTIKNDLILKNSPTICFLGSETTIVGLDQIHIQDNLFYFLPKREIETEKVEDVEETDLFIAQTCGNNPADDNWIIYDYCANYKKYVCPPDKKTFRIFVRPVFHQEVGR
jgi:4-amino-4-deoxy-L-arabinose transferase-like glycosyltransferase